MVADAVYRVILTVCGRGPASLMATLFSGRDLATLQELSVLYSLDWTDFRSQEIEIHNVK